MEIGNKIMELRKKNGMSQEELAEKLGVARQTISKWELGETSPDLKQSKEISRIFDVSLDELVSNDIQHILIDKASNTERLAGLILKLIKIFGICIIVFIVFCILFLGSRSVVSKDSGNLYETSIECTLDDEKYSYDFYFYEETNQIIYSGGDSYLANIIGIDETNDVFNALDTIDNYVKNNGGSCKKSEIKLSDKK